LFSVDVRSIGVDSKRVGARGVGRARRVVGTRCGVILVDDAVEMIGSNHASAEVSGGDELPRLPFRLLKHYAIVAQMVVKVLKLKARDELVEEGSTFVDLSLKEISVTARFQRLAVTILLDTLYASSKAR
jgi:hypothetical protein